MQSYYSTFGDMNIRCSISLQRRTSAFSRRDLSVVVLIGVVILGVLWAGFSRARAKSRRISCTCNLKQVGLGFRMWSNEHFQKFPMAVSTNKGGSLEFLAAADVFRHYVLISNEMNSPKVLTCPSDKTRRRTTTFATFSNSNLSYFVGLDAIETAPQMWLSGDRNITTNGRPFSGLLTLTSDVRVSWTKDIHN